MGTDHPKKMNVLMILEILKLYSDAEHRLSQQQLAELIHQSYQVKVDRHALKRNLLNLINFGYDIEYTETVRRKKNGEDEFLYSNWYINHEITDAELHMLIDSMLFSKYIPFGQNIELVKKLKGLSSKYFRSKRKLPVGRLENQHKQLLLTIEVLNEAIAKGDKVTFQFIEYEVDNKHHVVLGKDGAPRIYKVSPYEIVVTNGRYYLICAHDKGDSLYNYRLDYVCAIERVEDEKIRPLNEISGYKYGLDLSKYMEEHIYMYGGKSVRVKFRADLRANRNIIGHIMDWFGTNVQFSEISEDAVTATVTVNEMAMFYWALQYGTSVEIVAPVSLRERLREAANAISEKYNRKL
ncbi:helix-turn-helix transcriptional regulator [Paenibacillus planticolens]|uniref:WYL domain-containing protein n=1 Tax=Paenibacillus planticolens TaxID=2654976 RepID=A0ABX1ZI26_9BACL|nr:WYL domain-containing protein [Paenibacillus planticolens]NOU99500.1 WYL domain-containing protein [Paenibacillus planticolens]